MRRDLAVLVLLAPLAGVPAQAPPAQAQPAPYSRHDAMVPMSDGVRLDASVYLPDAPPPAGGYPLLVRQHGGGSNKDNDYDLGHGLEAVKTGRFALLMYSHRGHGASEGFFDFFGPRTTLDFSEMLDYVETAFGARIDTANTGVYGYSQGGGESLMPAAFDDRVKAVAVGNTFNDLNQALNPNDCFKLSIATAIFVLAYKISASRTQDDLAVRWGLSFDTDTEDVPLGPFPSTTDDLASRSPLTYAGRIDVPVFWAQAWEDPLFPADMPGTLLSRLESPVHYYFSSGGHFAGSDFAADLALKEASMLEWFDEFLRGVNHGFASGARPKVDYWQRTAAGNPGAWQHHTAAAWPIPGTSSVSYYPGPSGTLDTEPVISEFGIGTIANDIVSANAGNDPAALTVADALGLGSFVRGVPESPNPLDTATFTSDRLSSALDVTGAPSVHVPAYTSALRVAQLDAKLWDVTEEGTILVSRGCLSLEGRPIDTVEFDFSLWPNSHRFEVGHRVMLTLSAVDMPTFKSDNEPQATRLLSGARLDLPVTP